MRVLHRKYVKQNFDCSVQPTFIAPIKEEFDENLIDFPTFTTALEKGEYNRDVKDWISWIRVLFFGDSNTNTEGLCNGFGFALYILKNLSYKKGFYPKAL